MESSDMKNRYFTIQILVLLVTAGLLFAEEQSGKFSKLALSDTYAYGFNASSSLDQEGPFDRSEYGMHQLFDGDVYTGWAEGVAGPGIGEVLWLEVDHGADTVLLRNGFARTQTLFEKNNRIKSVEVSIWSGINPPMAISEIGPVYVIAPETEGHTILLADTMELREYSLPFDWSAIPLGGSISEEDYIDYVKANSMPQAVGARDLLLRIEITDVYRGSTWDDTCLTELRAFSKAEFTVTSVYDPYDDGVVYYDTPERKGQCLYKNRDYLYYPYLVGSKGRWAVAFETPAESDGRVETSYVLFRLPYPEIHTDPGFARKRRAGLVPVDFEDADDESVFLLFDDGSKIRLYWNAQG